MAETCPNIPTFGRQRGFSGFELRNLAEAERIRKTEAKRKKAEKDAAKSAEDNSAVEIEQPPTVKLTKTQAIQKAKLLAMPAVNECSVYNAETKRLVLEELIEMLAEELEKIMEAQQP